jgi:ribosome-associated translation inhibitor RaiA
MDLTVVTKPGLQGKVTEYGGLVHKHLGKKLEKLEQRWGKPLMARAVVEELPVGYGCTLTLHGSPDLAATASSDQLVKACDTACDKLTRQLDALTAKRQGRERQRRGSGVIKQPGSF